MPNYIVWYKKKIVAKNILEAVKKEKNTKPIFHSLLEQEGPTEGEPAIGFELDS